MKSNGESRETQQMCGRGIAMMNCHLSDEPPDAPVPVASYIFCVVNWRRPAGPLGVDPAGRDFFA